MLEIDWTKTFKKDLKKYKHAHEVIQELNEVIDKLVNLKPLLAGYKDHNLSGNWIDHRECHIKIEWMKQA